MKKLVKPTIVSLILAFLLTLVLLPVLPALAQDLPGYAPGEEIPEERGRSHKVYRGETSETYVAEFVGSPEFTASMVDGSWIEYGFSDYGDFYTVQHPWYSVAFYDYHTVVYDETFTEVKVYDDRWTVTYWTGSKWNDTGFWGITRSYEIVEDGIKLKRTGSTDIGQREEIYYFRNGSPCKIEIRQDTDNAQTIRFVWKPSGIVADSEQNITIGTGEEHEGKASGLNYYSGGDFVLTFRWFDELSITQAIIPVAESHAQGRKATITFGNFVSNAGNTVVLDPDTFYPDAHEETSSVDGDVFRSAVGETWSQIRDSAGTGSDDDDSYHSGSGGSPSILNSSGAGFNRMSRNLYVFYTAPIDDTAIVTAATLALCVMSKSDYIPCSPALGITAGFPASDVDLVNADYQNIDDVRLADDIAYGSVVASGTYNDFDIYSAKLEATIDVTGVSGFSARTDNDIDDSPASQGGQNASGFVIYFADAGGSDRPYLEVTYIIADPPTVTTQAASSVEDTTATGNGNITDTGGVNADYRGIAYDTISRGDPGALSPAASDYADYETEGPSSYGTGAFTRSLTGLPTGDTIYARAYAHNSAGWNWGTEVSFLTKPAAPTSVAASSNQESKVVITWVKSTGATDYHVWRGGADLGSAGDVATFDDNGATAGTITNAGTVTASDGSSTSYVTLSLASEATGVTVHSYKVVASNATGNSDDSSSDNGNRSVGSITYQWQRSAGDSSASYSNIGGATTDPYNDTGAPAGIITHGSADASNGLYTDATVLTNSGASVADGAGRYFQCIVSASGTSNSPATSGNNRGYRDVGSITYQWYRSAGDSDASYSILSGATGTPHNDYTAPAGTISNAGTVTATDGGSNNYVTLSLASEATTNGAGRYFKCYHTATGASNPGYTGYNRGYRGVGSITYQWEMSDADSDGNYNTNVGTTDPRNATEAPAGIITPGTASASDGTSASHVTLSLAGESVADGAGRYFQCEVSAVGASNSPQISDNDRGYRTTGVVLYQWRRSAADSDASFGNIGGATSDPYNDTGAPSNGDGRWYYAEVGATGTTTQDSTHNRGYRIGAATVTTQAATNIEDTTATGNGNIVSTGNGNCSAWGICWNTTGNPDTGDNTQAGSGAGGTGAFTAALTGLPAGTTIHTKAYATGDAGTSYGSEEDFLTKPAAATNVAATDGEHTDKVVVTWTKSTGATGYKVYEGTNLLDTLGDVATYDDLDAPAGIITPGTATASDETSTAHVTLSLAGESVADGATRTYKVVAFNGTGDADDSGTNTGYRTVGSITYQWQRSAADSDADYGNIGGATTDPYDDTEAPAGTITHGTITASDGDSTAHVVLTNSGESANVGAGRYYQCVLSATGTSNQTSTNNRGNRDVGSLTYLWYRSAADSDAGYSDISGATTDPYNDTGAPAPTITPGNAVATDEDFTDKVALSLSSTSANDGDGRYYKCYHTATGASPGYTGNNRGYRDVGTLNYQWERSSGAADSDYSNIDGATSATYDDTDAPAGTISNAGTVTSSDNVATHVALSLASEATTVGEDRYYKCALTAAGASPQTSASNNGNRDVGTITYQWQRSAADSDVGYGNIGDATTDPYSDTAAPVGSITPGTASAGDGVTEAYVLLTVTGYSATEGAGRYFRCIISAVDASNTPQTSNTDRGHRIVGTITFQWQRSDADADEAYNSDIGTTNPYNDMGAPSDGSGRWYRCLLDAAGASQAETTHDRGYKAIAVYEHLGEGGDADGDDIYGNNWADQQFTVGNVSHTITSARIYAKRVGSPGTVTLSLRYADGSDKPTGADLLYATLDGDAFSVNTTWYEFSLGEMTLESGRSYALVLKAPSGTDADYIEWRWDSGGGLDNAIAGLSTDGGVTWTVDAGGADYLFEIRGASIITLLGAHVFSGYLEEGDWLITLTYENHYAPYYPNADPKVYFYLQLLDGSVVKAQVSCAMWNYRPGSIYIAESIADTLEWGVTDYVLRLQGDFGDNPYSDYYLTTSDWMGTDLMFLDSWVIAQANSIGSEEDTTLTVHVADVGEVLNATGHTIFSIGIPELNVVRPELFEMVLRQPDYDPTTFSPVLPGEADWEVRLGPQIAGALTSVGNIFGVDGKGVGGVLCFVAFMIVLCLLTLFGNVIIGLALGYPFLLAGAWFGVVDWILLGVLTFAVAVVFVYKVFLVK